MKSIQDMVNKVRAGGVPTSSDQTAQASDGAKEFIDRLFDELKATYPAWGAAMKTDKDVNNAKRTWIKAFMENGIGQVAQVKIGLVHARKDARPFFPSVGEFIEWCKGAINTDEAFDRFINREPALSDVELKTRNECGHACRNQLPEDKARARFKNVYLKWQKRKDEGKMPIQGQKALPKNIATKKTDHLIEERMRMGVDKQRGKK